MIYLCLVGYLLVVGFVLIDMPERSEYDAARKLIERELAPLGILVNVTFKHDGTVVVEAFKRIGINVQTATVEATSILEAVWKLIKYVLGTIEQWIEQETYA